MYDEMKAMLFLALFALILNLVIIIALTSLIWAFVHGEIWFVGGQL